MCPFSSANVVFSICEGPLCLRRCKCIGSRDVVVRELIVKWSVRETLGVSALPPSHPTFPRRLKESLIPVPSPMEKEPRDPKATSSSGLSRRKGDFHLSGSFH